MDWSPAAGSTENNATEAVGGRRSVRACYRDDFKFEVPARRALCKSIV
jgi:hypothetical protein